MSTMKTLIIQPADVSLAPLGAGSSVADARVSVVYDRDVWVNGQPVPRVPLVETTIPTTGLRVPVLASDDQSITEGSGFVIKVIVETTPRIGQHNDSGTSLARTIQVVTADPDEIPLGSKSSLTAVTNPLQYADVMSAIKAAIKSSADAAASASSAAASKDAATQSASSAAAARSDAAAALDKITQAVTSQDSATAQNITSGSETRKALFKNAGDIRGYGATVEATDNGPAIQAAMDAAATNGGIVFVPAGTWNVVAKSQTLVARANVTLVGEDRTRSIIRVHESSGDWAYLFVYGGATRDNTVFRNLTVDGSADVKPTGTNTGWDKARTLFHLYGKGIIVEDCNLICNGTWAGHFVGDDATIRRNRITVDMRSYPLGTFDQSIIWISGQRSRVQDNDFATLEAASNSFTVRTAIEFQGHRFTVSGNKGGRFQNGIIFTAQTYGPGSNTYYTNPTAGAQNNVIEGNDFVCTRSGVEIWGMCIPSPGSIRGTRIRRNVFTLDNVGPAPATPPAAVSFRIGTPGASGHDGTQTTPVVDLKISDNTVQYTQRAVTTSFTSANAAFRLYTEIALSGVKITGNEVFGCGGYGVLAYVADSSSAWIDGLDVQNNSFTDVREPVRIVRNVRNWSVTENWFIQTQAYSTFADNMIGTVEARPGTYTDSTNGTVLRNRLRVPATLKPFYPTRDQGIAQSTYPAARGFVVEQMGVVLEAPGKTATVGNADIVRRTDGSSVRAQYAAGATLGTLTAVDGSSVTIKSVADAQTMDVSDATNISPGQVIKLPFNAPFASGSAVVVAVLGLTVRVSAGQLSAASGHSWDEAKGASLSYYGQVVSA